MNPFSSGVALSLLSFPQLIVNCSSHAWTNKHAEEFCKGLKVDILRAREFKPNRLSFCAWLFADRSRIEA